MNHGAVALAVAAVVVAVAVALVAATAVAVDSIIDTSLKSSSMNPCLLTYGLIAFRSTQNQRPSCTFQRQRSSQHRVAKLHFLLRQQ